MSELMLRDAAAAYDFSYVALRYFNVAGADPKGRAGQSTDGATHLIKVACEAALGRRRQVDIYGTDYPTHDGTGVRDYIHVSDLVDAHLMALQHLRNGGRPIVANCGYGMGYSVLDVLNMVMRVYGRAFRIHMAPRRPGDAPPASSPTRRSPIASWVGRRNIIAWRRSCVRRWSGKSTLPIDPVLTPVACVRCSQHPASGDLWR